MKRTPGNILFFAATAVIFLAGCAEEKRVHMESPVVQQSEFELFNQKNISKSPHSGLREQQKQALELCLARDLFELYHLDFHALSNSALKQEKLVFNCHAIPVQITGIDLLYQTFGIALITGILDTSKLPRSLKRKDTDFSGKLQTIAFCAIRKDGVPYAMLLRQGKIKCFQEFLNRFVKNLDFNQEENKNAALELLSSIQMKSIEFRHDKAGNLSSLHFKAELQPETMSRKNCRIMDLNLPLQLEFTEKCEASFFSKKIVNIFNFVMRHII